MGNKLEQVGKGSTQKCLHTDQIFPLLIGGKASLLFGGERLPLELHAKVLLLFGISQLLPFN